VCVSGTKGLQVRKENHKVTYSAKEQVTFLVKEDGKDFFCREEVCFVIFTDLVSDAVCDISCSSSVYHLILPERQASSTNIPFEVMIQSSRLQQRKLQHGKEMVIAVKKSSKKVILAVVIVLGILVLDVILPHFYQRGNDIVHPL